jgi:type VI secretion system protein ImpA
LRIVHQAIRESDAPFTGTSAERAEPSFTAHEPVARSVPGSRASAGPPPWMPIRSRADALLALDNVCTYLEHAEPGHPAPLLIRRVQRLMHMNFYDIVRDMAPTALPQLDILAGPTERP